MGSQIVREYVSKLLRLLRHDWPVHFVLTVTNWLPDNTPCLRLRGSLLQPFLGSCGRNLRVGRNVAIYNPTQLHVGSNVYLAYGTWIGAGAPISVEDDVMFGPYCVIASGDHTRQNGSFRHGGLHREPIVIGRGSWLAAHSTIASGARLGRGCLIAANSAVTSGSIPDGSLAGGVPAKIIRSIDE